MKKIVSLILTIVMVLGCVPVTVFSADLEGLMPEIVYKDNDDYLFVDGKRVDLEGEIFDYRHPQKNYINTYVPVKFFIELAGGELTSWEHTSKIAKFTISGTNIEIDYKNSTYSIDGVKDSLMFEPIIKNDVLYLSQTDLFVKIFNVYWSNLLHNDNGYMHIYDYDNHGKIIIMI